MLLAVLRVTGASAVWEIADKLCCCPDKVADLCWLSMSLEGSVLPKGDFALFACDMLSAFSEMDSAIVKLGKSTTHAIALCSSCRLAYLHGCC